MPCYNEERGLEEMLKNKPGFLDEVIVVDNASTDRTAEVAKKYQAKVVYENKQGYGFAYQAGLPKAKSDIIVTMDADCTYPLAEIEKMLKYMLQNNYDFVSGCRFPLKNAPSMPVSSRIGNRFTTWLMQLLLQMKTKDLMTGMWMLKRDILSSIMSDDPGMAFTLAIKTNAWENPNIKCGEFHIDYDKRVGNSKFNRIQDSIKCVRLISQIKSKKKNRKSKI